MLEFVIQAPLVPEGVTLSLSISVYEAQWAVPHIERIAKLLLVAEREIQHAEFELEQRDDADNG